MEHDAGGYPYRRFPTIEITGHDGEAVSGAERVRERVSAACSGTKTVIVAECYTGVDQDALLGLLRPLNFAEIINSDCCAVPPEEIDAAIERDLTDDPVFGIMTTRRLEEFFPRKTLTRRAGALTG